MGLLKKIFKPFKKVFKKIGKFVKRQFKRVGKWMGKLGIFGQVALMFIPGLGPMISGLFKGLGQGALNLLGQGLTASSPLIRGASWVLDTARKVAGGVYKGFKTVTSAATSFIKNTTKYLANKIPGINLSTAPDTFLGGGGDSVLGRVGEEVKNNFAAFKDTVLGTVQADGGRVGGLFSGTEARNIALQDQLNITNVGGVAIDKRKLPADSVPTMDPGMAQVNIANTNEANSLLDSVQDGINDQLGTTAANNFDALRRNGGYGTPQEFLREVQANPGFVNKFINSSTKTVNKFVDFQQTGEGKNPFASFLEGQDKTFGERLRSTFQLPTPGEFAGKALTSTATNYISSSLLAPSDPGPTYGLANFANYRPGSFGLQQTSYIDDLSQSMSGEGINGGYYGLGYVAQPTYA